MGLWFAVGCEVLSVVSLLAWRRAPAFSLTAGSMFLLAAAIPGEDLVADVGILVCGALGVLAGAAFTGRAAWAAGAGFIGLVAALYLVTGERGVGLLMLSTPGFVAGTVVRLHRQTADELGVRARELQEERELYARLAVRNERARIAGELHDIIGHSLSVMVVQAQAGQRLAATDPEAAEEALEAIAESAREGQEDLRRLVALLGGEDIERPDLSLIDEVVARAARSGLHVTCRFEGDHAATPPATAQLAFRVVQEALTNALRYAPGSAVQVLVRSVGSSLLVRVSNDLPVGPAAGITGSGRGLAGLRERVQEVGGTLVAGRAETGGWDVEARLPQVAA
jgi:signal transduction histidine kinase